MSNYSIPAAGPTTLGPTDVFQRFCHECSGFNIHKSKAHVKTCNHNLRMLPEQLEIYEMLQGLWEPPTNLSVSPTETIFPVSSVSLTSAHHIPPSLRSPIKIPLPERGEEIEGEGEEEGSPEYDAHVVEPQEVSEPGEDDRHDDWGAVPHLLRTRSGRAAFLRESARPPSTIISKSSTRAPSTSVATGDEDGDYSTDPEADGTFEGESYQRSTISDREVTGDIAEEIQASEDDRTTGSEEEYEPNAEEAKVEAEPTQLGSRNRPKRAREVWETKRGKALFPAEVEDLAGYPVPAEVFRTILGGGKSWIKVANTMFPVDQQVLKTKRNGKEDWRCRMKLALPRSGDACWVYNPVLCPKALNRDGYIRHVLDIHLGVERASGGSTRQEQIKNALNRCIGASAETRRGKRKAKEVEDLEDESEAGPSRKRMREN